MASKSSFILLLRLLAVVYGWATLAANGANGTWTHVGGGSWTNAGNWSGGVTADGSGNTANFSTVSLSTDATVTLDLARTIGNLTFDDQNASKHNWSLAPGGAGGPLTLGGATPAITVNSAVTTITVGLGGSAGLTKAGSGKLVLSGGNLYTGNTSVNAGTLAMGTATFSSSSVLAIAGGAVTESAGTLNLSVNASSTALDITGAGTLRLTSTTNSAFCPDLYFGPDHNSNADYGARIATPLDLGAAQRFVFGKTGHNGVGKYGLTAADCQFAGAISGTGGLTFIAQNNWTGTDPMEVPFTLNAANTFTGRIEIQRGSVYLGNAGALIRSNALSFSPAGGNNARLFLYGNNATISDLSGSGNAVIANGNLKNGASLTLPGVTLAIVQKTNAAFGGIFSDVLSEYPGSGAGTTGPFNLVKAGPALLQLTGASTHTGTTTITNGTLQVDGALGPSSVSVQNGGRLAGTGAINGLVTVQSGGALAPGDAGVGMLTVNNSMTLAGQTIMDLSKNGSTLTSDQVVGISSLTYGGSLVVTNRGPGTPAAGDSVILFSAGGYSGSFATVTLPSPVPGLSWDLSNLVVNGSITLVGATNGPIITSQPQSLAIGSGAPASFGVIAAGPRPLAYQWRKNGSNIISATTTTYNIGAAGSNDIAGYSVVVTNSYGSATSIIASLNFFAPGQSAVTNSLVVYLSFDNTLAAQAGTTNSGALYMGGATFGPRYTAGIISSAASFANSATSGQPEDWAVTIGSLEPVYSGSFSVSLWERSATSGDGALIGNKNWASGANVGWVISTLDPKNVNWNAVGGSRRDVELNPPFSDGNWHLVTVTFDRGANQVTSYIDGVAANTSDISPAGNASFNAGFNTLVGSSGNGTYSGAADIDDLAIWSRVLSSQEVAGIYGAGLNHQPLTAAVVGEPPIITSEPANIAITPGLNATFSVGATGPGPLTYQWRLNGANIAGATNATLVIASVTSANQGTYSVLVSNGAGAVLSRAAVLALYELAVTGQWDFKYGDLRATVGTDLEYLGDTATPTTFPSVNIGGQLTRVMRFGSNTFSQGFYMRHGTKPNGGGLLVNQFTLLLDLMFPASSSDRWRALFQTDPFNHFGNDADFYVGNGISAPDPNGIGAEGQYNGSLAPDTWYRIVLSVDLTAPVGQQLSKYVNGTKVASQTVSGGMDGRFALGPTAALFTTGLAGGFTQPGYVSSIQFVNGWMSPSAIAALGGPASGKLPPGNALIQITNINLAASLLYLGWTGPNGLFQVQRADSLANPVWHNLGSLTTNRTSIIPMTGVTAFYRVRHFEPNLQVGQLANWEQSIPSKQILRAAGQQLQFGGRPVDLALSSDGLTIYVKNMASLLVVDARLWTLRQTLNYPGSGASMHGISLSPVGSHVYATGAGNELYDWTVGTNGTLSFSRTISLPGGSDPCGLAISADGNTAYVCLSINNTLAVVDLPSGTVAKQISVGIAPWDVVLSPNGNTAYVSDWGGRFPIGGDLTATSAGTAVVVDSRGVAASGAVSIVDLDSGLETAKVTTGLHPSDLALSQDGATLYAANANSDTVSVINTQDGTVRETVLVRPDPAFAYGSAADGLALSPDGKILFVACAGNNAVAMVELPNAQHTNSLVQGFLPTDWYPGAVVTDSNYLYVANVKGLGTRNGQPNVSAWQIGAHLGTANKLALPSADTLSKLTAQAFEDGRISEIKQTQLPAQSGQAPVPVPSRHGEPSVFQHVLYILKENKTYDQVFGDISQGNGNASLCIYPQFVSPNHHALAEQYVLLDNYYCNGVNSADGHSWSTEANSTDHLEKSFGGFNRSYTFGDDPLTYSSTGFIWNNVLQHGLTFRNYGEFDYATPVPSSATWLQIYTDFTNGTHSIHYAQNIGVASLRPYSSTNVPGWNLGIPDVVRADGFIRELNAAQSSGMWANFHFLYLPNDHTGGTPTPQAQVADNDLALGQVVEAVTKSIFGSNTVIFIIEDDPQSGYDHVDAHRSLCLVVSPYTKRGQVISTFYNQAGVLHTMEQIMGLPPMNQQDAMAPLMFDCFTNLPDFTPYTALPNNVPLTDGTGGAGPLSPKKKAWTTKISKMDFSRPDRINENIFNRYIWYTIKGDARYPSEFVGAHGKGLKKLGLALDRNQKDDD